MRAVVTGASRGIGLELVRQLTARGVEVHGGARDPGGASELGVNNAGNYGGPPQSLRHMPWARCE